MQTAPLALTVGHDQNASVHLRNIRGQSCAVHGQKTSSKELHLQLLLLLFTECTNIGPESASTNTYTALLKLTRSYSHNENILVQHPDKRVEVVNSPTLYFYTALFLPSILCFSHSPSLIRMSNVNPGAEAFCIFSSHFGCLYLIAQQLSLKWKPASKKKVLWAKCNY